MQAHRFLFLTLAIRPSASLTSKTTVVIRDALQSRVTEEAQGSIFETWRSIIVVLIDDLFKPFYEGASFGAG